MPTAQRKSKDLTPDVERYWFKFQLPHARRYFRSLTDHMLNPDHCQEHFTINRKDARNLVSLLDELDRHLGKQGKNHD